MNIIRDKLEPYADNLKSQIQQRVEELRAAMGPYADSLDSETLKATLLQKSEELRGNLEQSVKDLQAQLEPYTAETKDNVGQYLQENAKIFCCITWRSPGPHLICRVTLEFSFIFLYYIVMFLVFFFSCYYNNKTSIFICHWYIRLHVQFRKTYEFIMPDYAMKTYCWIMHINKSMIKITVKFSTSYIWGGTLSCLEIL